MTKDIKKVNFSNVFAKCSPSKSEKLTRNNR